MAHTPATLSTQKAQALHQSHLRVSTLSRFYSNTKLLILVVLSFTAYGIAKFSADFFRF